LRTALARACWMIEHDMDASADFPPAATWLVLTRLINEFLHTRYTIDEIMDLVQDNPLLPDFVSVLRRSF